MFTADTSDRDQGRCEIRVRIDGAVRACDQPAVWRYPAICGGYMRLCWTHGEPHWRTCEYWNGTRWTTRTEEP